MHKLSGNSKPHHATGSAKDSATPFQKQTMNGEVTWNNVSWDSCPQDLVASAKTIITREFNTKESNVNSADCRTVPSSSGRSRRLSSSYDVSVKYGVVVNTQAELDNAVAKQTELFSDTAGTGALRRFTDALVTNLHKSDRRWIEDVTLATLSSAKAAADAPETAIYAEPTQDPAKASMNYKPSLTSDPVAPVKPELPVAYTKFEYISYKLQDLGTEDLCKSQTTSQFKPGVTTDGKHQP
jgi:hypothetical protein